MMRTSISTSRYCKAQSAFEFMFIFGIFIAAVILGIWFSWTKTTDISMEMEKLEAEGVLNLVSGKIDTVWLEGQGFRTNVTIPMKILNQNYTLNVTSNYLMLNFTGTIYIKPLITSNITGNLTAGKINMVTNLGEYIQIT